MIDLAKMTGIAGGLTIVRNIIWKRRISLSETK